MTTDADVRSPALEGVVARSHRRDEYLLHEFDHLAQSLLTNEESGEKRVQFFLAIVTAATGIIGLLVRREDLALAFALRQSWLAIAGCLFLLLLFGLSTALRLVERNLASDRYKTALRAIRRAFVDGTEARALLTGNFDPWYPQRRRTALKLKGGWIEVVLLVNAAIAGVLSWTVTWRFFGPPAAASAGAVVFVLATWYQWKNVEKRYVTGWEEIVPASSGEVVRQPEFKSPVRKRLVRFLFGTS